MHRNALSHIDLYCTACRTFDSGRLTQHKLRLVPDKVNGDFIISGYMECDFCGKQYPVSGGVPCLIPDFPADEVLTAQYMDAHYGDINTGYWEEMHSATAGGLCLDAGCATGRYTFDLAKNGFAVGIDLNLDQLQLATEFQRTGKIGYRRRTRAMGYEEIESLYSPSENVLFLLADVNDPPFSAEAFDFISGLNLIDSVKRPLTTLGQMDAMLKPGGRLLLSSPYAWDPGISEEWLETEDTDPHTFVTELLTGKRVPETGFDYRIIREKTGIPWLIRKHDTVHFRYFADIIEAEKAP